MRVGVVMRATPTVESFTSLLLSFCCMFFSLHDH